MLAVLCAARDAVAQSTARIRATSLVGSFVETIHSDVITQTGTAERHRGVTRQATFGVVARADTLVVTADTVHLTELADASMQTVDVDAVIGARWKLLVTASGAREVIESPVVPQTIADVSDIGTAMDDFFPPTPPVMTSGLQTTDGAGRTWRRLADSAALQRYRYASTGRNSSTSGRDSNSVASNQSSSEDAELAWDGTLGPIAWTRHIQTSVTTRFAGRTVRAQVDQRIIVRRVGS